MRNFLRTKFLIGFVLSCIIFTSQHSNAQWTPPTSSNTTVMVNGFSQIVNPNVTTFINANFENLSAGAGITGNNFNGSTALTWRLDTNWLDLNYANDLTSGSPILTFTNGGLYDGKANAQIGIDANEFSLEVKKTAFVVDGYQARIDTTPSVNPFDPTETAQSNITINTPYSQLSNLDFKQIQFAQGSYFVSPVDFSKTDAFSFAYRTSYQFSTTEICYFWKTYTSSSSLGVRAYVSDNIFQLRLYPGVGNIYLGSWSYSNFKNFIKPINDVVFTFVKTDGLWKVKLIFNGNEILNNITTANEIDETFLSGLLFNAVISGNSIVTASGIKYSDIRLFNFDMSAENSPYSVADYHAGKDIPIEVQGKAVNSSDPNMGATYIDEITGEVGWNISLEESYLTSPVVKGVWGAGNQIISIYNTTDNLPEGISTAIAFRTNNSPASQIGESLFFYHDDNLTFKANHKYKIRFSFYLKKVIASTSSNENQGFEIGINKELMCNILLSDAPLNEWVRYDFVKEFTPAVDTSYINIGYYNPTPIVVCWHIADLKFEVLGTSLALENDVSLLTVSGTPTKIIMDKSENNNYATVSGGVQTVYDPEGFMESYANLQFPTKDENGNPYQTTYTFQYDIPKLTYWTDGEFKVLDNEGNLVYWVSTQRGAQMGGNYDTNPATDLNAKIFYTVSERKDPENREWVEFVYNETNARTIYEHAQTTFNLDTPTIGGIIVQPNMSGNTVGGTSIKSIFGTIQANTNAGYSYVYARTSPTSVEKDTEGNFIWRPVLPKPIQKNY